LPSLKFFSKFFAILCKIGYNVTVDFSPDDSRTDHERKEHDMNPYNAPPEKEETTTSYQPRYSREERQARRRRRKRMRQMRNLLMVICVLSIGAVFFLFTKKAPAPSDPGEQDVSQPAVATPVIEEPEEKPEPVYAFHRTSDTADISSSFPSKYAVLLDLESGEILAERDSNARINPASMTKILTLLVASEQIKDRSGTFTMTFDITDYCYVNECSVVGYEVGEVIPVEELFYGCILSSGADACLAMAEIAAGSHEAFVELMNKKLDELGLSDTSHFTNCVGLYDEDHYCTIQDMAWILKAALENEHCKQVLETKVYHTAATDEHPLGQDLSNWFVRRIEDEDTGDVLVRSAKTGYVGESGFCAASCGEAEDGKTYLCVTGKSTSTWQSIYDHDELYRTYCQAVEDTSTVS